VVSAAVVPLDALAPAIRSRVLRAMVVRAGGGLAPSEATVAALIGLADGQAASVAGGLMASRGGGRLAVRGDCAPLADRRVDEVTALPELGLELLRRPGDHAGVLPPWSPAAAATSVPVGVGGAVLVRARRPADRIRTPAGTKTVADAMIDAGVPRVARDLVPVVEDEQGLLWVPGVAVRSGAAGPLRLRLAPAAGK
jgi:tRNA(Ile)-lysidine synthase